MEAIDLLKIIWPLIIIQLGFQIYAIIDLVKVKNKKVKNLTPTTWVIIIILGEILGAALYFIFGRSED